MVGGVGDSVNGILLGHPFTRTRRKLEDLIWRAVWIAFALAMPPIEPSVIYVHIHTYYAHLYTDRREYEHASALVCVSTYVYAVYTKEQFTRKRSSFVRSFVRSSLVARRVYTHAHRDAHPRRCTGYTHTYVRFRIYVCARHVRMGSYIS